MATQVERERVKEDIVKEVLEKRIKPKDAARALGVSVRTVRNYIRRYIHNGTDGLKDRRRGNYHKLTPVDEHAIIRSKLERPQRSARFIRDRLGLKVTPETVRLVLVKYNFSRRKALQPYSTQSLNAAVEGPS
jgi:transposase